MEMDITSAIAGAVISLVFSYAPKAKEWFAALETTQKRLFMLVALVIAALVQLALACSGLAADFGFSATCDRSGFVALIRAFFAALVVNQATFLISPAAPKAESKELVYEELR